LDVPLNSDGLASGDVDSTYDEIVTGQIRSAVQENVGMKFVPPSETNQLSDDEYQLALLCLERTRMAMAERDRRQDQAAYGQNLWARKDRKPSLSAAEHDLLAPAALLLQGDRDVIRNLRLYSQMFTGYSLAYMQPTDRCPWVCEKLPADHSPPSEPDFGYTNAKRFFGMVPPLDARFGECGWMEDGVVLNFDQWYYWEKVVLLDQCDITLQPHVLEIGGGFGGLASLFMKMGPHRYTIIDLPESLAFASIYLSVLFPSLRNLYPVTSEDLVILDEPGFTFVPSYLHRELIGKYKADVVINMQSMREMSESQVEDYAETINAVLAPHGQFFEQNQRPEKGRIDVEAILVRHLAPPTLGQHSNWGKPRIWRKRVPVLHREKVTVGDAEFSLEFYRGENGQITYHTKVERLPSELTRRAQEIGTRLL